MTASTNNITSIESAQQGGFNFLWSAFALVPASLLDEETSDLWLNFLRERIPHDQQIRQDAIPAQNCVCLVEVRDTNVDRPHVVSYLVEQASQLAQEVETGTLVAAIRQTDRLALAAIKEGKLQVANIYDSSTKEQTLYWILSIYEQMKLPTHAPLYIRCGSSTRKLMDAHLDVHEL